MQPADPAELASQQHRLHGRHQRSGCHRLATFWVPGMLALRLGQQLEGVVRRIAPWPDVLLLDATGCDHPRPAGLALHVARQASRRARAGQ